MSTRSDQAHSHSPRGYDVGVVRPPARPPADSRVMYEHLGFNALPPSAAGYVIGTASADVN